MAITKRYRSAGAAFIVLIVGSGGYTLWKTEKNRRTNAELRVGVDGARLVEARFLASADVRVGILKGKALGTGIVAGRVLTATQRTLAPFTIEYFIALKKNRRFEL